ncbi:hypothetical protein KP509_17G026100 [Ceratopteris richardii]|uniref:Uncharacterized protein n=1 Tax=Ceratopteris richardii TaxID=49495 RepID=A0A8T2SWF3_CERRI|nr:hypothetical protein KP509_17G026100 [Ceratopteris richardii]
MLGIATLGLANRLKPGNRDRLKTQYRDRLKPGIAIDTQDLPQAPRNPCDRAPVIAIDTKPTPPQAPSLRQLVTFPATVTTPTATTTAKACSNGALGPPGLSTPTRDTQ